ncbi:hypothetical protein MNEG_2222 [Monoraphidium neglectum]|uniref:Uncharacterized protein n=1 Tax=Monoraphidium neglectum TaxID=145388 RepID=A0A0D2LGW8_9CHLO|nr:hypothetical protein MNEG_2222 [Monoraphidium neglectum]KIZ05734.1 hypothetical protein MNEG_2222 [Monoraphidium neglectum]|eukprot:XP_013904753.1 hypothetical protein MNEG_2222 [Monoraphidium neglectum]
MAPLWIFCCLYFALSSVSAVLVPLNVLVLSTPGFVSTDFLESVMQGYGVRYSVVRIDSAAPTRINYTELLWQPDGKTPRWGGLIMYPNVEAMGLLNRSDVDAVWAFQRQTGVRGVKFGAWPSNVGWNPDTTACTSSYSRMNISAAMPLGISGIKRTANLSAEGLYRCPALRSSPAVTSCNMWAADFTNPGIVMPCNVSSILDLSTTYVGGTLVNYQDGREVLAFMFDCGGWSTSCLALGHLAVTWLLQNAVPGVRQALLTVQTDDVFLTTDFDAGQPAGGKLFYRLSYADLAAHISWQNDMSNTLPAGSLFRADLPINGNGILEQTNTGTTAPVDINNEGCLDDPLYISLGCNCWYTGTASCPATLPDFCKSCTKDWAKPLGTGTSRVPQTAVGSSGNWSLANIQAKDALATAVRANTGNVATAFSYCHHTFTHENLDNATWFDADQQLALNIDMAGPAFLNLRNRTLFSSKCMVTPQISGLRNGDALAALAGRGIQCVTGDNTWKFLLHPTNPHYMLYTTPDTNGYANMAILPRWATEVYFNCSTAAQNVRLYNRLYQSYYGTASTISDIMKREAARVVREGLLKLRKDPHMMHQANLAMIDGVSLLMRWTQNVVTEYNRWASWPVQSLKLDDLYAAFLARQDRDACQLTYSLNVTATGAAPSVVVTSAAVPGAPGVPAKCTSSLLLSGGPNAGTPRVATATLAPGGSVTAALTGVTWRKPLP